MWSTAERSAPVFHLQLMYKSQPDVISSSLRLICLSIDFSVYCILCITSQFAPLSDIYAFHQD
jgi:hypothetical protein